MASQWKAGLISCLAGAATTLNIASDALYQGTTLEVAEKGRIGSESRSLSG
jgi:hypothetical protein